MDLRNGWIGWWVDLRNGWMGGFKELMCGWVGEGWVVCKAYEVRKGGGKLRCLLLRRTNKNILFIFMKSLHVTTIQNGPCITTCVCAFVCQTKLN